MKKGDNLSIILFASMFSGRLGAFQGSGYDPATLLDRQGGLHGI